MVFGRAGYGKTEYVFNGIKNAIDNGCRDILLITPEQFSFAAERKLLNLLGEADIRYVDNSSFKRISDSIKSIYPSADLKPLSKGGKVILMMRAVDMVKDNLQLFSKHLDTINFVSSIIKIYDEMKSCNLTADEIMELSQNIENTALKKKLADICLIMCAYELQLKGKYIDSANELTRLYNLLIGENYFKDKEIFIDGFNGFVAQEYKILELIIKEAKNVTITLCTDEPESNDSFNLFGYVNNSAKIITKIANKSGVEISNEFLTTNYRAQNTQMLAIEKNIFTENSTALNDNNVQIYCAKDISDECTQLARNIKKLLRNGCRASDIAVITRDIDKYRDELSVTFKKYQIPFYNDERQPIKNQPLVVFIEYLLRCINYSLRSDDILSLAKTGLISVSNQEINELENYVFLWNINGMKWSKPFENSTKGFVSELSNDDRSRLERINETRKKIIEPILDFKNKIKKADATQICTQIYYTLLKFQVDKNIVAIANELSRLNKNILAQEQGRVWDLVMEILDQIQQIIASDKINLKDFAKIFSLVISTEDLGSLPSGIDNIQFGQADRIRPDNPRAVFILGANEGEFPQNASSGGLLSESDRRILLENDFKLYSYGEIMNLQERYFAYMACSSAKEQLYISYISGSDGDNSPSEIVTSVKNILNVRELSIADIPDIELIETYENAFELMSERYMYNTPFYSSLKEYFKNDSRFSSISNLVENKDIQINNTDTATELFKYNMYVSASRVEDFYNCAFRYFCKFGLNARPRKKAEIDPMQRGTLIHYVLEMILSTVGSKTLSTMTESEITALVDKFTNEFFVTQMGNVSDLSVRFNYNYKRLSKLIYSVVIHLAQEFSHSDFEVKAFELNIDKDGKVKPEILQLDDGGTIQIRGSIDRVDTYEQNGERFVRVVDYKSGNKSFNLNDIMHGLNLQMFIYLFSLCEDKTSDLTGTPAGVLYMHSSRGVFNYTSKSSAQSSVAGEESASFKMKGIVLDDENGDIAAAMENELLGKYIPVKVKKDGTLTGKLATLEELGLMHKKINSLVAQMGMALHNGKIAHNPVKDKNHSNTCQYCDYADVCANRRVIENRVLDDLTDNEVKSQLAKEFNE